MPSAMNGSSRTVQSASPDVGSAPGSMGQFTLSGQSSAAQTEAMKEVLSVIEKRVRRMEKKKVKLDDYQAKKDKGDRLNQDQLDALTKSQEVINNLEFARDLYKSLQALGQDIQKVVKKAARREQLLREEAEQRRLKTVLELQFLLDRLGEDAVRQDLRQATGGSSALLTDAELTALDDFYKVVGPERDQNIRLCDQYEEASQHLWDLLEGKHKAVAGTTYKALKESLDRVLLSGYFDHSHQNGVCDEEQEEEEEEEEELQAVAAEPSEAEEQSADPEAEMLKYAEPIEVEATEFVNRQFIPDATYSSSDKEQADEWAAESEAGISMQQTVQPASPPVPLETLMLNSATPTPSAAPVVRKQTVQDLMAQMQGPYNFMQDSMLDFDGQPIDPAIVSVMPMQPGQNMDLTQMVCPPVHSESRLSQPSTVPAPPESSHVPMASSTPELYSTPPPMYQPPHTPDPRPPSDSINPIQASMSLSAAQPLPPSAQTQVFQPVSKPPHSGGINVNAAPFQSMQTVFNLNAPIPPATEAEALSQASQYQNSYNSQGFSSQSQHPAEQTEMQAEQLQSVGAFQSQDQLLPSAGHQGASVQGPGFGRQPQAFYNSRGTSRGGPRNARGMVNGYRGSSNGFRGGYEGYRPPFANAQNAGYGQTQFSTPRDYSNNGNSNYQREGYQPNYKRGSGQGPRGVSRGNAQALRS